MLFNLNSFLCITLLLVPTLVLSQSVCSPNPCFNGGTCVQSGSTVGYCVCQNGYSGSLCQTFANNCTGTCFNGGSCILQANGQYVCQCVNGYYGSQCLYYNTSPCSNNPCMNNGVCTVNYSTYPNYYQCTCAAGYSGTNCQLVNACSSAPCLNGGSCILSGSTYSCQCTSNYYGPQCQYLNSNPCSSNPCLNSGACVINYNVVPNSYTCTCVNGYSGINCQTAPSTSCVDTNTPNCQYYAANNLCSSIYSINGVTIPNYCPKSCNTCTPSPSCTDTYSSCSSWVASNYCNLYPVYALCKKSCNLC